MNNQNLNETILNYQNMEASITAELQTVSNNKAVIENNLNNLNQQAQQLVGTTDITQLSTILEDLIIEQTNLENELNKLNMEG